MEAMMISEAPTQTTLEARMGFVAGEVFRHLYTEGEASLTDLKRELGETPAMIAMAVGWLAREEKIVLSRKGAGYLVQLNA
jgi:hypothetical protein